MGRKHNKDATTAESDGFLGSDFDFESTPTAAEGARTAVAPLREVPDGDNADENEMEQLLTEASAYLFRSPE